MNWCAGGWINIPAPILSQLSRCCTAGNVILDNLKTMLRNSVTMPQTPAPWKWRSGPPGDDSRANLQTVTRQSAFSLRRLNYGGTTRRSLLPCRDIAIGWICILNARLIFFPAANEGADEAGSRRCRTSLHSFPLLFFACDLGPRASWGGGLSSCTDDSRLAAPSFVDHTLVVWSWNWRMNNSACCVGAWRRRPVNCILRVLLFTCQSRFRSDQIAAPLKCR